MGFYSEEDIGLYRANEKHFIIPVPENTVISKEFYRNLTFTSSFTYEKEDENGVVQKDVILYRISTVKELEDLHQKVLDEEAERQYQEEVAKCEGTDQKPKRRQGRPFRRSQYPNDLVIMYRDSDMHDKMVAEFRSQLGMDSNHTLEKLEELGPKFGIIILRTNYVKAEDVAKKTYCGYKKRWGIETHYNFVENTIHFCGLHEQDYAAMQGLSFLTTTFGQVKSAFVAKMRTCSDYVKHMSIKECLAKAGRLKLSQHKDKKWYIAVTTKKNSDMMTEMGVNMPGDISKLISHTY